MTKRNNEGIKRKRKNEGINRRKDTLVKKSHELGKFDGVNVALIICKHGRRFHVFHFLSNQLHLSILRT